MISMTGALHQSPREPPRQLLTIKPNGPGFEVNSVPGIALSPGSPFFTIRPARLTITATSASGTEGEPLPTLGGTISGFQLDDTACVINGLTYTSVATSNSPAGIYEIIPTGGTAANYVFLPSPAT